MSNSRKMFSCSEKTPFGTFDWTPTDEFLSLESTQQAGSTNLMLKWGDIIIRFSIIDRKSLMLPRQVKFFTIREIMFRDKEHIPPEELFYDSRWWMAIDHISPSINFDERNYEVQVSTSPVPIHNDRYTFVIETPNGETNVMLLYAYGVLLQYDRWFSNIYEMAAVGGYLYFEKNILHAA